MSCHLHSSVCLSTCLCIYPVCTPVCLIKGIFASARTKTLFPSHLLAPHLHEGDVVEKRADSGGFKPHLLGNETIDGAKEGAERQK